jgi:hypothetical protein
MIVLSGFLMVPEYQISAYGFIEMRANEASK